MEGVYVALVGLASAVLVKLLDRIWQRRDEKKGAMGRLSSDLKSVSDRLDKHIADDEKDHIIQCRYRIQRFNDEILLGQKHSKEFFDSILIDITEYDNYCSDHSEFRNQITSMAEENIKRVYKKCLEEKSFL